MLSLVSCIRALQYMVIYQETAGHPQAASKGSHFSDLETIYYFHMLENYKFVPLSADSAIAAAANENTII